MIDFTHKYLTENAESILHGDSAIREDALPGGTFRRMVQSLNGWMSAYLPPIDSAGVRKSPPTVYLALGKMADGVNTFNGNQWKKATKANLGVDFPVYENWWSDTKEAWADDNYTLIKSMASDYVKKVNIQAEKAIVNGYSTKQLAAEIMKIDKNIKASKAAFIACDQIGKLNGHITQARMQSVGLSMYIWSTSGDSHVRGDPSGVYPDATPSHYLMDGLLCRWDDATVYSPDSGKTWIPRPSGAVLMHPGEDYQCRCTALSYWDELIGEVDHLIDEEE